MCFQIKIKSRQKREKTQTTPDLQVTKEKQNNEQS